MSDIQKCSHSVYLESKEAIRTGKAFYCWLCRPSFCLDERRDAPNISLIPAHIPKDLTRATCPRCGALTHFEGRGRWICSECSNEWSAPRKEALGALVRIRYA
jgi:hypothetical protein